MGVRSLRSSIAVSVFVHFFFMMVCAYLTTQRPAMPNRRTTWVELDPLKLSEAVKNPTKKAREAEAIKRRQLVQTEKGHESEKAAPDAFLGEKTQTVDRPTVSDRHETVMGQAQRARQVAGKPRQGAAKDVNQPKNPAAAAPLARLGIPLLPHIKEVSEAEQRGELKDRWATPGHRPQDYVKGMKEGDVTALNTREFVFYGYYQRIRERLDRAWVPILRSRLVRLYARGRQLASDMEHTTRVMVVLDPRGEIVRVEMMLESGTQELDDAAVSAFKSAGPFPNPPRGIVEANGEVRIPWEFILRS